MFGGEAAVNFWFTPNWSAQLDFQGEATTGFDDPVFNGDNRANIDIGAHLTWWRTPFHAVGLLAGYSDTRIVDDISMQRATLGVEGQLHPM
jgi:hypothetical protein